MIKEFQIFFITCLLSATSFAQSGFSGFGKMPVKTPDSLLQNWNKARNTTEKFSAAKNLILFHEGKGTNDSVIFYADLFVNQFPQHKIEKLDKAKYLAFINTSFANAFEEKGLYNEALRYYILATQNGTELNDETVINQNKFGQAKVYFNRKQYDKAISLFNEIINVSNNNQLKQLSNKQLGILYLSQNKFDEAKIYLNNAQQYFEATNQLKHLLETRLNIGIIEEAKKQTDTAFSIYNDIKERALQQQFFDIYIRAGQRIGDIYFEKKNYESAKVIFSMVYTNAMQWDDLEAQQKVLNSLQKLYAKTSDYANAYALSTQYTAVTNRIAELQNKKEVNELEIKYNTAQKEKEIIKKQNQLERQTTIKYGFLIGFVVVLIPIIALLYVYYQKLQTQSKLNATIEEANKQKITSMIKEKELELLMASVKGEEKERNRLAQELHDSIGGNLAAIKMQLSQKNNAHNLMQQLDDTYQQVRDLSHNLAPKKFNNTGFTELVETYLHRFNLSEKMNVRFQAYPEEEVNNLPVTLKIELYKIIQELMTNVQKHANAEMVEVQLTCLEYALKLMFEDNGKGFVTEKTPAGIGLQNIEARLKNYNAKMQIDSFPQRGTIIDIEIPLKSIANEA